MNDIRFAGLIVANFAESVSLEARTRNGQVVSLPVKFAGAQAGTVLIKQASD